MLSHLDKHYDLNALYKKVKTCPNKSVPYKAEMKEFQHALEKLSARGLVKFEIDFTKNKITPAITKKGRLVLQLSKKASYHSAK